MSVVRRCSAGAVVAGLVLLGGPAWAQEDPCAPGADGSVPEMCQSGPVDPEQPAEEPAAEQPVEEQQEPAVDPCPPQPVEPGDGVVTDGDAGDQGGPDQGVDVGEPNPGAPPSDVLEDPATDGEPKDEQVDPETVEDASRQADGPPPGVVGEEGVMCAFNVPVSAPESAAGGGVTSAGEQAAAPRTPTTFGAGQAAGQLPRTGPYDRVLAVGAVGAALVIAGAGAAAAGRRRSSLG